MKIWVSLSDDNVEEIVAANSKYFSNDALVQVYKREPSSTETVIFLSPDQYLYLTDPGDDFLDEKMIKGFVDDQIRFNVLPYLGVETDADDGTIYVSLDGRDHQGRRMMRSLKGLGVNKVPVVINSQYVDDGPVYVWGTTDKRPTELWGYKDNNIPFPKTHPY